MHKGTRTTKVLLVTFVGLQHLGIQHCRAPSIPDFTLVDIRSDLKLGHNVLTMTTELRERNTFSHVLHEFHKKNNYDDE